MVLTNNMEANMNTEDLKYKLIESLGKIYFMEAFSELTEFLQGELRVLYFLSINRDKEINPSILSDKLHISRPRITAALTTLRKKGYVDTEISKDDRRRIRVILTKEGLSFIQVKQKNVEKNFELFAKGLGEENSLELIRLIDLIVNVMENENN